MTTADEFRNARFATHPDGRIAARVDPNDGLPWIATMPRGSRAYRTDAAMAADGWSPLDESRAGVVTDEMVEAGARALQEHQNLDYSWEDASATVREWHRRIARPMLTAALSAAPAQTTTKSPCAFAAERLIALAQCDQTPAPTTDEDARTYALEQIEAAQAETTEAVARAEKAEQERDEAIREAGELGKALDNVKPMDTMTAREHLDAAWAAAYVPEDGIIPAGAVIIRRNVHGTIYGPTSRKISLDADGPGEERRLLDPPTPVNSYTKRLALELENAGWIREGGAEGVAEHLDALGVRAPEDGEER